MIRTEKQCVHGVILVIFWSLSHRTVVLNNLDCMRIPNFLYTMFDIFLFKCWLTAIFFFTVWQNRDDKGHTQSWLCNQVFNELFLWRESETKIWNVRIHAYTGFNEKTAGKKGITSVRAEVEITMHYDSRTILYMKITMNIT